MTIQLTATQRTIIEAAAQRTDGSINPLPARIRGGAQVKVINALEAKGLIENISLNPPYTNWVLTDAAYEAIGMESPKEPQTEESEATPTKPQHLSDNQIIEEQEANCYQIPKDADPLFASIAKKHFPAIHESIWPAVRNAIEEAYAEGHSNAKQRSRQPRENSKQAMVIALMRRPEGASLEQIIEATSWSKNTIRGAISGSLKKKLGLNVTREKVDGITTYRITE
uniref:DUF3489 domain-containing protein n=1 Tax=Magnetococcus massalia (strain MO-1) TaxID=451514 RepID=A0A1S7LJ64_MAGMO|nr:conserved protein of unknown function [Candidatus Magnetococcus massalia]